jgi:RIO kinase 1
LLKDVALEDPEGFYKDLMLQMRRMYHHGSLVHCDMSEYNILVHDGEPYIIDMGQAVLRRHPMAREFIERDARNLSHLFKRRGFKIGPKEVLADLEEPLERKKTISTKAPSKKRKGPRKPRRAKRSKGVKE